MQPPPIPTRGALRARSPRFGRCISCSTTMYEGEHDFLPAGASLLSIDTTCSALTDGNDNGKLEVQVEKKKFNPPFLTLSQPIWEFPVLTVWVLIFELKKTER